MGGSAFATSLTHTAKTTDYTVTTGDSGTVISNVGAVATTTFTLPDAALGLNYEFVSDGQIIIVDPQIGDTITINGSTGIGGRSIENGIDGWVRIVAISSTAWLVMSHQAFGLS